MLHYKTQLYILREHCSKSRETASREAKLSGRTECISAGNGASEPTGVQTRPLRVGCGILERQGEEGISSLQTPQRSPHICGGDLWARPQVPSAGSQRCHVRQLLRRHALGEKLHSPGYTSWVWFSYISHELRPDSCKSSAGGTRSIRCNMTWQCRKKSVQVVFMNSH